MREMRWILILIFFSAVAFRSYSQDMSYIDKKGKEALLYPNPLIVDKFTVKAELNIKRVEVVNVIGKVINRTENEDFEIRELLVYVGKCEKGMYFVKITFDDNKSIIKKLLVK